MSDICANILEIIEAIEHFRVFLGPELKAVTGDSAGIDEVIKRVENLTVPLKIPFEEKIFDKSYEKPWDGIMKKFRASVAEIEKMTEQFIKESFRKLRSAEGAFELVKNFQKIGNTGGGASSTSAAGSIQQQISDRYKDILEQYMNELASIKQLFNAYKDRPHLYKNFPPVAGAIAWARDLYQRAKRPILRFKKHGGLLEDEYGEKVKNAYLEFAKTVDNYITDLYNDWEGSVTSVVMEKLRMPVLCSIANASAVAAANTAANTAINAGTKQQSKEGPPVFVLPPPPYRVSFAHELKMIIKESRYLDKLGFKVPEVSQLF
jgi:dynein heavy chain